MTSRCTNEGKSSWHKDKKVSSISSPALVISSSMSWAKNGGQLGVFVWKDVLSNFQRGISASWVCQKDPHFLTAPIPLPHTFLNRNNRKYMDTIFSRRTPWAVGDYVADLIAKLPVEGRGCVWKKFPVLSLLTVVQQKEGTWYFREGQGGGRGEFHCLPHRIPCPWNSEWFNFTASLRPLGYWGAALWNRIFRHLYIPLKLLRPFIHPKTLLLSSAIDI